MIGLVSRVKTFRHRLSSLSLPSLPPRLRGGSIERSLDYLKNVFQDYRQVLIDVRQECVDRPLKASTYGSVLAIGGLFVATNPTERDLRQQLIECQNRLSSVPKPILNANSCDYVLEMNQLMNEKLINIQSFGLFSVIFTTDYAIDCQLFHNQCSYLRPTLRSYLFERLIDIGFVGKYRRLDHKMIDYDINPNEWTTDSQTIKSSLV